MAMARSLSLLLLLSLLVAAAAAARSVGGNVQEACSKSQFPKICGETLAAKPESQKATPRRLAELFVGIAAEKGAGVSSFLQSKLTSGEKDAATLNCYDSCGDDVDEAVAHLSALTREPTDAKFLELKSWLSSTLGGTSTCEDACKDVKTKDDVIKYSFDFEKMLRVTLDLITEASGSMSADIALPPSDASAPSYGAAAPFGGSPSEEAPTASPAYGGAASGPSAGSPPSGGDAPAPSSGGDSGAPAPSDGSSTADAPSSGDSDASAPSSEDGDDDVSDDDTKA